MTSVYLAVEGRSDIPVAERLVRLVGLRPQKTVVAEGKHKLDLRILALNRSGTHLNWLILRDLDHDAPCASRLIRRLLKEGARSPRIAVRVAVRAMESWMLADSEGFAREFAVPRREVPRDPDNLVDPKQSLVNCCRRSRKSEIRATMVPQVSSGRQVGTEYTQRISTFATRLWSPERASERSPSLQRTIKTLRRLVDDGIWT